MNTVAFQAGYLEEKHSRALATLTVSIQCRFEWILSFRKHTAMLWHCSSTFPPIFIKKSDTNINQWTAINGVIQAMYGGEHCPAPVITINTGRRHLPNEIATNCAVARPTRCFYDSAAAIDSFIHTISFSLFPPHSPLFRCGLPAASWSLPPGRIILTDENLCRHWRTQFCKWNERLPENNCHPAGCLECACANSSSAVSRGARNNLHKRSLMLARHTHVRVDARPTPRRRTSASSLLLCSTDVWVVDISPRAVDSKQFR